MNNLSILTLKALRKLYTKAFRKQSYTLPPCEKDPNIASRLIFDKLAEDKPCMIARFGSNELLCMLTYIGIKEGNKNPVSYITGKSKEWWWNETNLDNMHFVAGFYPREYKYFERFCKMMINDITELDILGSWLANETVIASSLLHVQKVHLRLLEPYWSEFPWSMALQNKKVLVVHPFDKLIEEQYRNNRLNIFNNTNVLPIFHLQTLKAVQSSGEENTNFEDWFEALQWMKDEIDKRDYDICLIGCGAYGFPLAAHVKRQGKKAVHLGGALQLLFGIKGKRWEDPNYGINDGILNKNYLELLNDYWISPDKSYYPQNIKKVENGCYW